MGTQDRRKKDAERLRLKILDAAAEIVSSQGYGALSLRKIASRLEYSPGIIYHYFTDKAEIISAIVERGHAKILALLSKTKVDPADPEKTLLEALRAYTALVMRNRREYRLVLLQDTGDSSASIGMMAKGAAARRENLGWIAEAISLYVRNGIFRELDPELSAQILWASVHGLMARFIMEEDLGRERRERLLSGLIGTLVRGFRRDKS
jgi:AcrR family transcriptional regulator